MIFDLKQHFKLQVAVFCNHLQSSGSQCLDAVYGSTLSKIEVNLLTLEALYNFNLKMLVSWIFVEILIMAQGDHRF